MAPAHGLILQLSELTLGRPYHATLCRVAPRHATVSLHTHQDFYELFYVVSGQGEHRLSNGRQMLHRGDLVLVRPSDWHYLTARLSAGLEWINVAIPVSTWRSVLDLANVVSASELNRDPLPTLVSASGGEAARLESCFREALARYALGAGRLDLMRFILDVLEVLSKAVDADECRAEPEWLVRACTAMNREENLRGGVRRLGELAGISASHLCRTMREHYGMTPTAFVTDLRMRSAEMLLAATSASVTAIAYRCGFSSPSYFSKCFHSSHGLSPRDFRRRARLAVLP